MTITNKYDLVRHNLQEYLDEAVRELDCLGDVELEEFIDFLVLHCKRCKENLTRRDDLFTKKKRKTRNSNHK